MRAECHLVADRADDGRVTMPGQCRAVAAVQVDVLVPVNVVDLRALAVAEPDRLRAGDLPAGRHPAGERVPGPLCQAARLRLPPGEHLLLLGDDSAEDDLGLRPLAGWQPGRSGLLGGHVRTPDAAHSW